MIERRSTGTIRSNLSKIVIGALVPLLFIGGWQGILTYQDSRNLVAEHLRANAWSLVEDERDPFIIARHALMMVAQQEDVRAISPRCNAVMDNARDGATGILNFLRTDRDGFVRCSGLDFDPAQNLGQHSWWRDARDRQSFVLGGPQIGEVSRRPVVMMAIRLTTAAGAFDGTASAAISLERLHASLEAKQRALGGAVLVTDRAGNVLVAASPAKGKTAVPARFGRIANVLEALDKPQLVSSVDGKGWTFVAVPLSNQDLLVVYAEPQANFSTAALSRIWLILALPLLAAALSLVAVWFATQRLLLDWFPRLHRLTERIAQGEFDNDPQDYGGAPREIADMAADLHAMAASLDRQERALHAALEAQKALTAELHHRVRNNLQIMISLLTMQADRARQGEARDMLEQARARVAALGLIHRLLYDEDAGKIGTIGVARLLGELCAQVRAANHRITGITLECAIEDATITVDHAVPLLLFALEAITNAYRHAFTGRGQGQITLHFRVLGDDALLEIADDGVGMDPPDAPGGTGVELLQAFAEQIGGILMRDALPQGLRIALRFPLAPPRT